MDRAIASGRNIVLVTVDSLRADHCYSPDLPTPAIDALRDDGVTFETAIAPGPATYESMPATFTGSQPDPAAERGGLNKRDAIASHLGAHRPLPARLRDRGYTTVGVTPNPFTSRQFGFDAGFDQFVDFLDAGGFGGGLRRRILGRWSRGEFVGGLRFATNMLGLGDVSVDCATVAEQAIEAVEAASEPVFLWLMVLDPHWPYRPPRRYHDGTTALDRYRANWRASNLSASTPTAADAATLRQLYRGTVRSIDDCIATLQERLASLDPIVVLHADHGEAFGEHGSFGHGETLYEENIRVPLVVGNIGASGSVTAPTSLRALPRLVTGLSDGAVALDDLATDQTFAVSESGARCVRGEDWKYYVRPDAPDRLYDLQRDPDERDGAPADVDWLRTHVEERCGETRRLKGAVAAQEVEHQL